MRNLLVPIVVLGIAIPGSALAQSSSSPNPSPGSQTSAMPAKQLATAQKIKQDLEKAGFTDVSVVAESFVVQAKSKDGDPVIMTIGPHGMTLFEASTIGNKPGSTGSTSGSAGSGSGSSGSSSSK